MAIARFHKSEVWIERHSAAQHISTPLVVCFLSPHACMIFLVVYGIHDEMVNAVNDWRLARGHHYDSQ